MAKIQGNGVANFAGVRFNSDTLDANTLDDYEEGTWTPDLKFGGVSAGTQDTFGRYIKIGKQVTLFCNVTLLTLSGATGNLSMDLPFTPDFGNTRIMPSWVMKNGNVGGGGFSSLYTFYGSPSIEFLTNNGNTQLTDANFYQYGALYFIFTYFTIN